MYSGQLKLYDRVKCMATKPSYLPSSGVSHPPNPNQWIILIIKSNNNCNIFLLNTVRRIKFTLEN